MNSYTLFHFAIQKGERVYQFAIQPGAPWEELEGAIEDFKKEFADLKVTLLAQEAEKAAQAKEQEVEAVLV